MTSSKTAIATDRAPGAIGPYSQAIRAGNLLFCSGQIALDPATGALVGGDDVAAQTHQVMANLGAVLEAGGAGFAGVVKTTIFLADMNDFPLVNDRVEVFVHVLDRILQGNDVTLITLVDDINQSSERS